MKNVVIFIVFLLGISLCAQAKDCPYCGGRGYTVKNTDVAGYGLAKTKKKCDVCGEWVWEHTAHQHIPCKHCNSTGQVSNQSSSGLSSYGNAGSAQDRLNAIAQDNPRAYASAMSIKYGNAMSDGEYQEYRTLPSDVAATYMNLRNLLGGVLIHFNQSTAMAYYKSDSPTRISNYMNDVNGNVQMYEQQLDGRISQSLVNYISNLHNQAYQSAKSYLDTTLYFSQFNNLQQSLDNYLLQMNLF